MNDFNKRNAAQNKEDDVEVEKLYNSMNVDQKRIVDKVINAMHNKDKDIIIRSFISGGEQAKV